MTKRDEGRIARAQERYERAAHRVQTAIAFWPNPRFTEPKHMRVGVDMSKSDMSGLAKLLLDKKVFTIEEYHEYIAEAAEREADTYEHQLSVQCGINVRTL